MPDNAPPPDSGFSIPTPQPTGRLDVVESPDSQTSQRPWLGIWYACANKYTKVFRSPDGQSYCARCPTCAKETRFRVGTGGVSTRFFEIRC